MLLKMYTDNKSRSTFHLASRLVFFLKEEIALFVQYLDSAVPHSMQLRPQCGVIVFSKAN